MGVRERRDGGGQTRRLQMHIFSSPVIYLHHCLRKQPRASAADRRLGEDMWPRQTKRIQKGCAQIHKQLMFASAETFGEIAVK